LRAGKTIGFWPSKHTEELIKGDDFVTRGYRYKFELEIAYK